jgi:hypothetical protein
VDRRQTLVPGSHAALPLLFELLEEAPNVIGGQGLDFETVDGLTGAAGSERQQKGERVAIAPLRVAGEVSLADEVLEQVPADPRTEQCVSHGRSSRA